MPGVGLATRNCSGHAGWPPRPPTNFSDNFIVNGLGVVRKTNNFPVHCNGPSCHAGVANTPQDHFIVNGQPITRNGDVMTGCASAIANGSPNFIVG